jgi:hypothetical protein
MTAVSDETGRDWLPLKYEDGPDFCTVTFATGAAFALTVHPERMKLMEAALSASPVGELTPEQISIQNDMFAAWVGDPKFREAFRNDCKRLLNAASASPVAQEPVARLVPIKNLVAMLALLPPAPVDVNGEQFAYHDPNAAERLLELRSVFDALIAASPLYTSPPATSAGLGADEIARVKKLIGEFETFLNEPPQYEDQRMVRDYRHVAYRKWEAMRNAILALLSRAGDQK